MVGGLDRKSWMQPVLLGVEFCAGGFRWLEHYGTAYIVTEFLAVMLRY